MEAKETMAGERPARSAEEAVERLRAALHEAGIILPSLRIDPVTGAHGHPYALVDLGRCNLGVASRLAAALRRPGGGA
ncbi:hypothetical protein J2Z21_005540 [Streptomyces griseochromogenes]|uniref:Uncharacterized protein n=1 Tax=Streptomyces griseochromogenes TaxID=68214 RepID=A0A1B1BAK7_9ACTN|nr:hypothetical protein [Streptomyces griseochromogenes]ANP55799.1 hypothetical protein AVL59_44895 [Streptomyces griseochromogenes]MBP2052553.1 hypothetical protein [Streptomyces griseochromogenes]